jgi:ABC-type sugar transport system permease subunit
VKKRGITLSGKRAVTGWLFILPFTLGFIFFIGSSLVMTGRMSLANVEPGGPGQGVLMHWNSYDNYTEAFTRFSVGEDTFPSILVSSISNMLIDLPLIIFFSLFMAILLNQKFRGRTLVRAIFFLPVILGAPAIRDAIEGSKDMMMGGVSTVSSEMAESISGSGGTVNAMYYLHMLTELGLPPGLVGYVVGVVSRIHGVILSSGVQIVIFVAALQSIPPALYEVSKIEGATAYETFWKVTFPMVMPLILTNIVYTIIDQFAYSSVVELSYDTYFSSGAANFGLGAVFSLVSSAIVCAILLIVGLFFSKRTHYAT